MRHLTLLLAISASLLGCGGSAADTNEHPEPTGSCSAYGVAPEVTTIRTPVSAEQPHPDCIEQPELSPLGQRVYCCLGADFDAWYARLRPTKPGEP